MAEALEHGLTQGESFIVVPIDAIVEESLGRESIWPKVTQLAADGLQAEAVQLSQVLVECYVEHHLGKHLRTECHFPASIRMRHYVFQEAPA